MDNNLKVIKIGGNVVDNPEALSKFIKDFSRLEGHKIIVHGGGKEASRLSRALGIEPRMIEGRRVTDRETLEIVTMVYAGLVNKRIVSALQASGSNAIGLSGCDGAVVKAKKRPVETIDYGYVGDLSPEGVNVDLIENIINHGLTPVFCAIMYDGEGNLLNCNADSVASTLASAFGSIKSTELVYCFEKDGVMLNPDDDETLIPLLDKKRYRDLKESGAVSKGMIPKLENSFRALECGVKKVTVKNSGKLSDADAGTTICL